MSSVQVAPHTTLDPRIAAFCRHEGPEIFRPVAYPTEVWTPDPLDVESIHAGAREEYQVLLDKACKEDEGRAKVGRILLLLGESGSGKTHLMRAFRTFTHRREDGYFAYMQMTSSSGNYSRYMLHKLIDSLDQPYYRMTASPDATTGLMRLSNAVAESPSVPRETLRRLREDVLDHVQRAQLVMDLADAALEDLTLKDVEIDLVRSMFFLQCDQQAIRSRVLKYLRGESLSNEDRKRLAGVVPVDRDELAQEFLRRMGDLIWATQKAALVLCVDQLEDVREFDDAEGKFRRAMIGATSLAANVPNAIVVIACLEAFYGKFKEYLDRPPRDRIEKDPKPITLEAGRTLDEIEVLVSTHLRHLYAFHEAAVDDDDPLFPFRREQLEPLVGQRMRSVLEWCKDYREACILAGRLLDTEAPSKETVFEPGPDRFLHLDQSWNDHLAANFPVPDADTHLAEILCVAIQDCDEELGGNLLADANTDGEQLALDLQQTGARLLVGLCNLPARGGGLTKQVAQVLDKAGNDAKNPTPVIVRSEDYKPTSPKTKIAELLAQVVKSGGRRVTITDTDWRTFLAMKSFRQNHSGETSFREWLSVRRPLSSLPAVRELLDLDNTPVPPKASSNGSASQGRPSQEAPLIPTAKSQSTLMVAEPSQPATPPGALVLGRTNNRAGDAVTIEPKRFTRHAAFLGSTSSGKTTAALNIIEQLLLCGVPAILIDRKGDLVSYARPEIWDTPLSDPDLDQRRRALRDKIDVAVYTPGEPEGRPLMLPVAPSRLNEMKSAERAQTARAAAQSLGEMLGYKAVGANGSRIAIMVSAIELLAEMEGKAITLEALIDYIDERDDALVSAIGKLDTKLFDRLVQDLQTLQKLKSLLFTLEGEPLDGDALFGVENYARPGKTRLTIISTKFLGDLDSVRFWVAQFLLELERWTSKRPKSELQAVVMFDEADIYLPATSKPATKEPMESLLKRARSAGLGVFLATQSPGDFDYKCRENLNTWFIGRVKEEPAIKKMKPMLSECKQDIAAKLASQQTGEFFLVQAGDATSIRSGRSVVETRQEDVAAIRTLARRTRPDDA